MIKIHFLKVLAIFLIGIIIGFVPSFSMEISESYSQVPQPGLQIFQPNLGVNSIGNVSNKINDSSNTFIQTTGSSYELKTSETVLEDNKVSNDKNENTEHANSQSDNHLKRNSVEYVSNNSTSSKNSSIESDDNSYDSETSKTVLESDEVGTGSNSGSTINTDLDTEGEESGVGAVSHNETSTHDTNNDSFSNESLQNSDLNDVAASDSENNTVNQQINQTLTEVENNLEISTDALSKVENINEDLLKLEQYLDKLTSLNDFLKLKADKTSIGTSILDVDSLNSLEDHLYGIMIIITDLEDSLKLSTDSTDNLSLIKGNLENLNQLTSKLEVIPGEYGQRSADINQGILSTIDEINFYFAYIGSCYLAAEYVNELKKIGDYLSTITENLEKTEVINILYPDSITRTEILINSISDLENSTSQTKDRIKALSDNLRNVGMAWVEIYRGLVENVPPSDLDPDYLDETVDALITAEIRQKALDLGNDPLEIYNFVQSLSYDTYFGSSRGSVWTLSGGSGNDFDKSSLLLALLRAAGYPARYVHGWVEITPSDLIRILGGKSVTLEGLNYAMTLDQALGILTQNGVSYEMRGDNVAMEHILVEAALPTQETKAATQWLFEISDTLNLGKLTSSEFLELYSENSLKNTIQINPGYSWVPLDPSFSNYTNLEAVNYSEISDELRQKIQIITSDGLDSGIIPLPLLAKKKIIIEYIPADENQAATLGDQSLYRVLDNGGINWFLGYKDMFGWYGTPNYIYVKPVLIIGDQTISTGNNVPLGSGQNLMLNLTYPNQGSGQDLKSYRAGDMYSVTISPAYEPPSRIREEAEKTAALKEEYDVTGDPAVYDEMVAQLLYTTGITYYSGCDSTDKLLEETFITKCYHSAIRCDYVSRGVKYWESQSGFFQVYANYLPGAISHDSPINQRSTYSLIGQEEGRILFNLKSAFAYSGWESQSISGLFEVEAVSTTYILAYAQSQGIPVYVLNQENLADTLPLLNIESYLKDWISSDVNAGYQVIIPGEEVTIGQWHGTGWAVINNEGGGVYWILGGLNGNYMLAGGSGTGPTNTYGGGANGIITALLRNYIPFASFLDSGDVSKDQEKLDALITLAVIGAGVSLFFVGEGMPLFYITLFFALFFGPFFLMSFVGVVFPMIAIALVLIGVITFIYLLNKIAVDPDGEIIVPEGRGFQ
jgi:hypothetical protein